MSHPNTTSSSAVIIGGGISGLSTAWYLQKQALASDSKLDITVLEASDQWGGKIAGEVVVSAGHGKFIIDGGPDQFITRKRAAWDLTQELDLSDEIVSISSMGRIFVVNEGEVMRIPLDPVSFITSPLLTPGGKLRMLAEPFIRAKHDESDETLADFTRRRLGEEALNKMLGPVLAGIYNADPEQQSILSTAAVMREMEAESGSLFLAAFNRMLKARKSKGTEQEQDQQPPRTAALRPGMTKLVGALLDQLEAELCLNAPVQSIEAHNDQFHVKLKDGTSIAADAVIVAAPAPAAASMLAQAAPEAAERIGAIRQSSIGTITLAYNAADVTDALDGYGVMVPRREGRAIDAVTWTSNKMAYSAPTDCVMLRVFFGGARPELTQVPEEELVQAVQDELRDLLKIDAEPILYRAYRWPESFPQYDVGHLDRVAEIETLLPEGLYITGSPYKGIGLPDCIQQGYETAQHVLMSLDNTSH